MSIMTFATVLCVFVMVGSDSVASESCRAQYYTEEYKAQERKKHWLEEGFYDIEIVTAPTTQSETTTTTTETTTTTSEETTTTTTTTESTTTTEITTTETEKTTKKSTTSKTTTSKTTTESKTTTTETESTPQASTSLPITNAEFIMLANLVAHEYGANWVATAEKAKVVAVVMNRVRDSRFPNNVRSVILQRNQFCWVPDSYYWNRTTQGCKDAVTYYFAHQSEFSTAINSFWGDGRRNHFYHA